VTRSAPISAHPAALRKDASTANIVLPREFRSSEYAPPRSRPPFLLMFSFPELATQLCKFVAPGLYAKEKKAFLPFLLMTTVLCGAGDPM
jgi:hypothetical protein